MKPWDGGSGPTRSMWMTSKRVSGVGNVVSAQQKLLGHFNLKVIITYNLIGRFNTCNRLLYFRVVEIT